RRARRGHAQRQGAAGAAGGRLPPPRPARPSRRPRGHGARPGRAAGGGPPGPPTPGGPPPGPPRARGGAAPRPRPARGPARRGALRGGLRLTAPKGIRVEPALVDLDGIQEGEEKTVRLQVRADADAANALHAVRVGPADGANVAAGALPVSVGVVMREDRRVP